MLVQQTLANLALDFANNCKWVFIAALLAHKYMTDSSSVGYAFINFEDVSLPDPHRTSQ